MIISATGNKDNQYWFTLDYLNIKEGSLKGSFEYKNDVINIRDNFGRVFIDIPSGNCIGFIEYTTGVICLDSVDFNFDDTNLLLNIT